MAQSIDLEGLPEPVANALVREFDTPDSITPLACVGDRQIVESLDAPKI